MTESIPIITAAEVGTYTGVDATDPRLVMLVGMANDEVNDHWPAAAQFIGQIPPRVKSIALEVAARPVRNPKGLSSWTRSLDIASRTERLPDSAARAGVFVTEDEAAELAAIVTPDAAAAPRPRIGSIRTRPGW